MADYTVIADVGKTLLALLRDQMPSELISQPELIGLCSPVDSGDLKLSLFLYNIRESGDFQMNQMINRGTGDLEYPPKSYELSYLLTAYSKAEAQFRSVDESLIIGKAMQIINDNAVLRASYIQGSLAEKNEEIKIAIENLDVDVLLRLWNFPNIPYKLSLGLIVSPVFLDSTRKKPTKRVKEVEFTIKG